MFSWGKSLLATPKLSVAVRSVRVMSTTTATVTRARRRSGSQAFLFTTRPDTLDVDQDVFGLDESGVRDFVVEQRRRQDIAAAQELRGLTAWADLHRVVDGTVGAVDDDFATLLPLEAKLLGREDQLRLAGQGTFTVTEFAITEIATALGLSEFAARARVGQALELRDRLPRLWTRVMDGDLPAWKGCRIAAETIPLNRTAAGYVDAHLAPYAHRIGIRQILRCVNTAIALHDPAAAQERAERAGDARGVWTEDRLDGVGELHAVLDTPDLHALERSVRHGAADLLTLGDTDPEQVRRAKALGILADPQYALDLAATAQAAKARASEDPTSTQRLPRAVTATGPARVIPTIHLHVHTDALADDGYGVARVEGAGIERNAYPITAVERWLTNLAPGSPIKLTPVVDLHDRISVDAYEIPDRLRQQIEHRDTSCRFPWCGRTGRYDLDHIDAYVTDDDSGRPPPAQTNTVNLARLCRYHHRVKTHSAWTYHRRGPTTLEWTSPLGNRYTVDHNGTVNLS